MSNTRFPTKLPGVASMMEKLVVPLPLGPPPPPTTWQGPAVDVKPEGQLIGCEEVVLAEATACAVHKVPAASSFAAPLGTVTVPDTAGPAVRIPEPAFQLSTVIENGGSDSPPLTSESL